jgi:hypothetical protein
MKIIQGETRGSAIIGPGYFRALNSEQFQAALVLYGPAQKGNDRTFDVWKAIALQGQVTPSS